MACDFCESNDKNLKYVRVDLGSRDICICENCYRDIGKVAGFPISSKESKKSVKNGTGARGLKSILEDSMIDLMYNLPNEKDVGYVSLDIKDDKIIYRTRKIRKKIEKEKEQKLA